MKRQTITSQIKQNIIQAIIALAHQGYEINVNKDYVKVNVEKTKNSKFGDFTTNVALSIDNKNKMQTANGIIQYMNKSMFADIKAVEPGFINMWLSNEVKLKWLKEIKCKKAKYGNFKKKRRFWYNIEFVSANPTGLLHIGHARNGAYGDSLANIFEAYGVKTDREYYINDGGNQVEKLGLSVLIRYLQLFNKEVNLPEDAYHAEEIVEVATKLKEKYNDQFINTKFDNDKILDNNEGSIIKDFAKNYLLNIIKKDLNNLNVKMEIWSPESNIYKYKLIDAALDLLKNETFNSEGATWLKTTSHGDDKDRVLIKSDGSYTYFMPDIAYHNLKISRGYTKIFNIWGADHKSYADRMSIALQLLGYKKEQLVVLIMQLVKLTRDGKEFKMSKRTGNSFTVQDLIELIGKDAARWYLVNQSLDSHLEIDVAKAKEKNNENGLYYVQYAYVRIKQILNKAVNKACSRIDLLTLDIEKEIMNQLLFFKPTIKNIAKNYEVQKLNLYLTNLAKLLHSYYANEKIANAESVELSKQRLFLVTLVSIVIKNGLKLLGIDTVESM